MIISKNQVSPNLDSKSGPSGPFPTKNDSSSEYFSKNFYKVKKITKELKEIKEKDNINLNSLKPDEMKKFVNCLPQHKLDRRNLEIHFNAIEYILKKEVFSSFHSFYIFRSTKKFQNYDF